ncbi:response regulator [Sphingomonas sp. DBB INV C78]|uniref:response regulator n=1 Tax=Sphingomonas sp. DBB INV C78 TaxID=3349434 RepID=UPI0036D2DEE9
MRAACLSANTQDATSIKEIRMHALVIEDEYLIAALIEDELGDMGYHSVAIVNCHKDAVSSAQAKCPDLITADDRLVEGSGIDAVKEICADKVIPVVYILGDPDMPRDLLPYSYLMAKPFTLGTLRESIGRAVERARDYGENSQVASDV